MRKTRPGDLSSGYFYEERLAKTALVVSVYGEGLTSPQPLLTERFAVSKWRGASVPSPFGEG